MLRAYEFYILLGKYKRDALTPSEFETFAHAIRTVRKFRHAFHESTGDRKPFADRSYKTGKPHERARSEEQESGARATQSANSHVRRRAGTANQSAKRSRSQKAHLESNKSNDSRSPRPHSRRRHRWLHLSASMLMEYRKALAIATLGLFAFTFAIWWFANKKTAGNNTAGIFEPASEAIALRKPESWSKFAPTSVAEGSMVSEADQLLSLASTISDSSSWRVPAPAQTSLEQAIWNEMDTYFSRPEEVFGAIKAPEVPME